MDPQMRITTRPRSVHHAIDTVWAYIKNCYAGCGKGARHVFHINAADVSKILGTEEFAEYLRTVRDPGRFQYFTTMQITKAIQTRLRTENGGPVRHQRKRRKNVRTAKISKHVQAALAAGATEVEIRTDGTVIVRKG